jgi:hypothetical protein
MPDTMIHTPVIAPAIAPAIPVEIAKAIGEIMTQIKSLPKGERNDHGHYDFASIDDFLAAVGPLCSAAGLIVYQDEDAVDLIDRGGKAWLKVTYAFRLGHVSGILYDRPARRTVFQAITGPQTTGSCQSYALKQYLRSMFLIPTGDRDDADYGKQQDMAAAPQKPPQRVEPPRRTNHTPKQLEAIQHRPSEPQRIPFPAEANRDTIGGWLESASSAMEGQPEPWRRAWLEVNQGEVEELRKVSGKLADRVEAAAIAPDLNGDAA